MTYAGFIIGPIITDWLIGFGWKVVWIMPAALSAMSSVIASTVRETRPADAPPTSGRAGFERRVAKPAVAVLAANFGFATLVAFLPEYAERQGISRPGVLFAVYAVAVLIVRGLTGALADRIGPARFTMPTLGVGAIVLLALAAAREPWHAFVAIALVGASLGATFPAATAASLARVGSDDRGKAMGTTLAIGDIGQATAGPLVGYLSTQIGFRWLYVLPAIVCLVAVMTVATLPEVKRTTSLRQ